MALWAIIHGNYTADQFAGVVSYGSLSRRHKTELSLLNTWGGGGGDDFVPRGVPATRAESKRRACAINSKAAIKTTHRTNSSRCNLYKTINTEVLTLLYIQTALTTSQYTDKTTRQKNQHRQLPRTIPTHLLSLASY